MNVLAIDTSGPVAGVAILKNLKPAYEAVAINHLTHSVNLMPMIQEGLTRSGLTMSEINLIACAAGPGSFTGVRIGISTAKALAHTQKDLACVAVDTLEALAQMPLQGIVCPILDARAGQVYGAIFRNGERLGNDQIEKVEDFLSMIHDNTEPVWFIGDGVTPCKEKIISILNDRARFVPEHMNHLRPLSVAYVGLEKRDHAVDYLSLQPFYLRAPQAERERAQRKAANDK